MTQRKIEYLPLAELEPDPTNPKAHALGTLGDSIGRFGYVEPIVRDERTGKIISGHGRTAALLAAHARGDEAPDGVIILKTGGWAVPVVTGWASRSDTDAAAALIALNRTGEVGGWDNGSLLSLLDELAEQDGLLGVGFDTADIDALRDRLATIGEVEPLDEFPAYDDDLETHYRCPSCAYEWSGSPRPETAAITEEA